LTRPGQPEERCPVFAGHYSAHPYSHSLTAPVVWSAAAYVVVHAAPAPRAAMGR
jgi:hypothetical protein